MQQSQVQDTARQHARVCRRVIDFDIFRGETHERMHFSTTQPLPGLLAVFDGVFLHACAFVSRSRVQPPRFRVRVVRRVQVLDSLRKLAPSFEPSLSQASRLRFLRLLVDGVARVVARSSSRSHDDGPPSQSRRGTSLESRGGARRERPVVRGVVPRDSERLHGIISLERARFILLSLVRTVSGDSRLSLGVLRGERNGERLLLFFFQLHLRDSPRAAFSFPEESLRSLPGGFLFFRGLGGGGVAPKSSYVKSVC
mmetsp:Transcript_4501/g.10250  ORF Transcript_4501/g.10250 Transcript_4501/m.10250 type:complete len:255 (-) Transcript_4501:20-784(-)